MTVESDSNCTLCTGVSVTAGVLIFMFCLRKFCEGGQFVKSTKMTNKVVLITGGNTGIGKETAIDLATRGAKVYIACRDQTRGDSARLEIIEKSGNENVFLRQLDLASFESIRKFASDFTKEEPKLDVLINNAGCVYSKGLTKEKFEMCFGVNHLGHFLLTNLLLDTVKKASPSRIIVVSSIVHLSGRINKDNLNCENESSVVAYGQSKLANIMFTKYLAKELSGTGVVVNSLHPGVVDTEIYRNFPLISRPFLKLLNWFFFKTPKSGAQTTICLAVDPELEKVTGKYFTDCTEAKYSKLAYDDEMSEWLWRKSEELTNVRY